MKIAIIGPGAVGSLLTYALNNAGYTPDVFVRDASRLKYIKDHGGLRFIVNGKEEILNANLKLPNTTSRVYDGVLIAVKAYDLESALSTALKIVKEDGIVVSFQNGIGPLEMIESKLSKERAGAAVITYGLYRCDYVTFLQGVGEILLGQRTESINYKLLKVAEILEKGGLNVKLVNDIDRYRWFKLLINAGINPVTTIFQAPNKVIIEVPEARELALKTVKEGYEVVKKLGIKIPSDPVKGLFEVAKKTANNFSSMLQDVINDRETEIDYINGVIVKYGMKLGINTPINTLLVNIIKGIIKWRKLLFLQL